MKPKRTDKSPHPSRSGRIISDEPKMSGCLPRVEKCLGRPLTGAEVSRLRDLVSLGTDLRHGDDRAALADVRYTLLAIARLPDGEVPCALESCDEQTRAEIAAVMPESRTVQEAAALACERLRPGAPGAPERWYQREMARRIHALWQELAGAPGRVWSYDDRGSPTAGFAQAILSAVEGREFDLRKAVRLMLEANGG